MSRDVRLQSVFGKQLSTVVGRIMWLPQDARMLVLGYFAKCYLLFCGCD